MYPQAVVRLEGISTYITFECVFSILLHSTGAGFCFLCRNASFRLAFLLSVDGLDFFLVFLVVANARPLSIVSREKEKLELIVREKLKAKPWPASVWQRSRHLAAKEESLSPTAVILVYF